MSAPTLRQPPVQMPPAGQVMPSLPEPSPAAASALPVALHLDGPHVEEVRRWTESVLGWQPVDTATAGLVPPAVRLVDPGANVPAGHLPTVLLVPPGTAATVAADAAARLQPDLTVAWPDGRDRLSDQIGDLLAHRRAATPRGQVIRIGGAAGGVGTTTVTLALTALAAWNGQRTLAVVTGHLPLEDVRTVPADALASPDLWERASPLPGVPDARALRADGPDGHPPDLEALVLHDVGVDTDVDVLVLRADRSGLEAARQTVAAAVIVVDGGCAAPATLQQACGGRRRVDLPWSHRVARAGLDGRVPGGLPGSYLRRLLPVTPRHPGTT